MSDAASTEGTRHGWVGEGHSRPRVLLLGSGDRRPQIIPEAQRLRPLIEQHAEIVLEDFQYDQDLAQVTAWARSSCRCLE